MRLLIAALLSIALIQAVPTQKSPVNNSEPKAVHTIKAEQPVPSTEKAELSVAQVEIPVAQMPEVQPEPAIVETPAPEPPVLGTREEMMAAAGIPTSDWAAVDFIVSHESSWDQQAVNASSGSCGLAQALPCSKMASHGTDYATNPVTQLRWMKDYANGRYGSFTNAMAFWRQNNWY